MCSFTILNAFTAPPYAVFTLSAYRSLLTSAMSSVNIAVGASVNGEPAGLALSHRSPGGDARVLSIYVRPEFRRKGIGTGLLQFLEKILAAEGCGRAEIAYKLGTSGTSAFERLIRSCQWPLSGPRLYLFALDGAIMSAPWFDRAVLPSPYEIADWATITASERSELRRSQEEDRWIPDNLFPFRFEENLEPLNSLLLRRE